MARDTFVEGQLEVGYRHQHVKRGDGDGNAHNIEYRRHAQQRFYLKEFHGFSKLSINNNSLYATVLRQSG
jgi:hypothetical protein